MITSIKAEVRNLFVLPAYIQNDSFHFISSTSPQTYLFNARTRSFYPVHAAAHPFHLVSPSPWPFSVAAALGPFLYQVVSYLHELPYSSALFLFSGVTFLVSIYSWFKDVILEATIEGQHTSFVIRNLRNGMILFIVSEVMFFASFFWAFFYCSVSPSIFIGCIWPAEGIVVLNPFGLPYLNTLILLSSGVSVTWAHRAMACTPYYKSQSVFVGFGVIGQVLTKCQRLVTIQLSSRGLPLVGYQPSYNRKTIITSVTLPYYSLHGKGVINVWHQRFYPQVITILLGLTFTALQAFEYSEALFTIADSIYGSTFYLITGFHGFHVVIGTVFLLVCFFRYLFNHFTAERHFGFEAAIWYWHFVDVVWLIVFVSLYWWGNSSESSSPMPVFGELSTHVLWYGFTALLLICFAFFLYLCHEAVVLFVRFSRNDVRR